MTDVRARRCRGWQKEEEEGVKEKGRKEVMGEGRVGGGSWNEVREEGGMEKGGNW